MSDTIRIDAKPYYQATLFAAKNRPHAGFVLDVGCGENPLSFQGHFENYVGVEININALRRVSRRLHSARLICASGSNAPFKDGIFDLVICTEVLEHLDSPEEMIAEFSRILVRGGTAIVSIPTLSLPQTIILWIAYRAGKISKRPYQSPDHVREYARFNVTPHFEKISNLFELFRLEGLEVQDVATVQSLYTRPRRVYDILLSKIEKPLAKILSSCLFGHHTVLAAKKK